MICILVFQVVAYIFYPTHDGHEISVWFLGAMLGWYIGSSSYALINNKLVNLCLSFFSIGVVFAILTIGFATIGDKIDTPNNVMKAIEAFENELEK